MRRSGLFSAAAVVALLLPAGSGQQQPALRHEADGWARTYGGRMPGVPHLRIIGHGPVNVEAGIPGEIVYTVKLNVAARTQAEAARLLARYRVQITRAGDWAIVTTPAGKVYSTVTVTAPR